MPAPVTARPPRATRGYVTVVSATGGRIRAEAAIDAGGQRFTADDDVRLTADERTAVAVTAATPGAAGNVAAGVPRQRGRRAW